MSDHSGRGALPDNALTFVANVRRMQAIPVKKKIQTVGSSSPGAVADTTKTASAGWLASVPNLASLPACNVDNRRMTRMVLGAAGAPDSIYVCMKKTDDTYAWVETAAAP